MGWRDLIPSVEELTDGAKKGLDVLKGDRSEGEAETSSSQEPTDLEQLTAMLNDPDQGPMFEQQFGMDISGAKENDGVVTKDEAVTIVAKFSKTLFDGEYLDSVDGALKKEKEAQLREELGDEVGSYDQLDADHKDAFLTFVATPEVARQEAIQKAVQGGAFSYAPNDGAEQDQQYVVVDGEGNVVNFERPDLSQTQAYTEVPTVPQHIIDADNDLG